MTTETNEVKNVYEETKEQEEARAKAIELQKVLNDGGWGIQPFLRITQSGILPDAKLVKLNEPTTGDKGASGSGEKKRPNPRPKKA